MESAVFLIVNLDNAFPTLGRFPDIQFEDPLRIVYHFVRIGLMGNKLISLGKTVISGMQHNAEKKWRKIEFCGENVVVTANRTRRGVRTVITLFPIPLTMSGAHRLVIGKPIFLVISRHVFPREWSHIAIGARVVPAS